MNASAVAQSTFREVVEARAASAPLAPFAFSPESGLVLAYGDLASFVGRLESAFAVWEVAPGHIVAFMLPNGLAALQAFVGTMAAGRIVAPINLLAQDSQLDYVLAHAAPRIVFATDEHAGRLSAAISRVGVATRMVQVTADAIELPQGPPIASTTIHAGAPAMLMYTSGTTGVPKGVLLSHANMLAAGRAVASHQSLDESDRVLSSLPLYHINGQCISTVSTLVSGGSLIMPARFSASQWWPLVERFSPTWLNLVPTIVSYLLNGPELTPRQLTAVKSLRFARSASSPLSPDQQRAFEVRFGIPVIEAMGLTESASVAFCNPMELADRKIGSPGLPLAVSARVVAPDGRVLGAGEAGEIELSGPTVMSGYYHAPELTAKTLSSDGWLATGDLGHRDADGFYFITGRLKELIIKGGENIAPREIDEALLRHPAVLEAAAVGVPDRDYGQEILACVVARPGATLVESELREHCLRELGRYKSPRYWRFVDALPKGASGKVQRLKLAELPASDA